MATVSSRIAVEEILGTRTSKGSVSDSVFDAASDKLSFRAQNRERKILLHLYKKEAKKRNF